VTPEQLLYTKTHEWVHVEKGPSGKIATVGISAFAIEALTDLVFIELPPVGQEVQAGKPFGEVESVKAVSDLYSPVDGEIVEVNRAVPENLEILAKDPYGAGWLIKVKLKDEATLVGLMDYRAYQKQCDEAAAEQ
jgi:glycine cleavage system H protein